ncbi:zinc ribbon domain-containing protein [Hungatella hathewayi]|uniref:zinc ribbon domain-containing protein n=1 Tax=Hungatella hathewayi TaxID=154046 RepID=UPI0035667406
MKESKNKSLKDQILVLALHKGFLPADLLMKGRIQLMKNTMFQGGRKAKNTWLAGKIKCGRCGYALKSSGNAASIQYLHCSKRADNETCEDCGTVRTSDFQDFMFAEMVKKFQKF